IARREGAMAVERRAGPVVHRGRVGREHEGRDSFAFEARGQDLKASLRSQPLPKLRNQLAAVRRAPARSPKRLAGHAPKVVEELEAFLTLDLDAELQRLADAGAALAAQAVPELLLRPA